MSDPEVGPGEEETEQAYKDTDNQAAENGIDSISGVDPLTQHAEEGSNTTHPSEQPDVISSYTGRESSAQAGGYGDEDGGEAPRAAGAEDVAQQQDEEPSARPPNADADGFADGDGQGDAAAAAAAAADDSVYDQLPGEAQEPEPGDDTDAQRGPADAGDDPPAASTSRPASATNRPTSARPTSARPGSGSTRPGSARPGSGSARQPAAVPSPPGSRPISASLITPDSVGLLTQQLQGRGSFGGGGGGSGAGSSHPGSSHHGSSTTVPPLHSEPQQQQPLPPPPLPPPQSVALHQPPRPLSFGPEGGPAVPATVPEDRPLHPALIDRYIAPGLKAIEVEVEQGPGLPHRLVRVLMDLTQAEAKPYLGGFRNKRTGIVFHHAGTQTPRAPKYSEADRKLSRETQTVKVKQHSQQTVREQATQMMRPGVLLDVTYDREVTPGRYQTADERDAIVLAATRCIQRWVRGWLGRRRAAYLRRKKAEREAFLREQELAAQAEAEEHRRREIQRRMHPRTAADFEVLYNELEAWRLQETRKIKEAGLPREQEQQVLQQLLHKETKLLQTIDRLKINANQENKEARIQHTLSEMSRPKKFALRNGGKVDVHTPFTTRAKELQQLYNGLNLPLLTVDERLDVLLHVKWTVKEFDCDLTREIVDLIDREADLLNRGRSPKVLEGLRKRISSLFLAFIETPEFNPEAARFQIVPMDFETYLYEKVGKATAKAGTSLGTRPTLVV
ncbi:Protein phosphatase 1G [Pleodorina starrii]|nr:Protein phosphatase 1G [Pleodorina starrii]